MMEGKDRAKSEEAELLAALYSASPAKCAYLTRRLVRLKIKRKR